MLGQSIWIVVSTHKLNTAFGGKSPLGGKAEARQFERQGIEGPRVRWGVFQSTWTWARRNQAPEQRPVRIAHTTTSKPPHGSTQELSHALDAHVLSLGKLG